MIYSWFIQTVSAQAPCALVPGGCAADNPFPKAIAVSANVIATGIAALCVLMIVWGGVQMGISFGDDSKIAKGRESIQYAMIGLGISLFAQSIINYAITAALDIRGFGSENLVPASINWAISTLVYFFNIVIFIVIFYGGIQYVMSRGSSDKADNGRKMVLWAVIGGVCINASRLLTEFTLSIAG
jgi:TRAP-type C4-dicarboxylate transport system permease small subunit